MSTYVFGDIQGCFDELQKLLGECQYNKHKDQLWFVGDLINRGPKNLETMKFILELDDPVIVLGNHDLHFLAVANNIHPGVENDTIQDILDSAERKDIIEFLRQQKLLHHDTVTGYTMVHAGIPAIWDLQKALNLAKEVEFLTKHGFRRKIFVFAPKSLVSLKNRGFRDKIFVFVPNSIFSHQFS